MPLLTPRISSRLLLRRLLSSSPSPSPSPFPSPAASSNKVDRLAAEFVAFTDTERRDFFTVLGLHLALQRWTPTTSPLVPAKSVLEPEPQPKLEPEEKKEKMEFNVKLDKFDAMEKLKVVKAIYNSTSMGLREAIDIVEKVPVVIKQGVARQEAEKIIAELKEVGAIAILE